ncbi:ATP-dependent Clp protease proteolytic subunit [Paraburkholderia heleia]|uniref:ATP-dependent Clp protease proteolytic subunit n=1 Tax=Paraburkholderia heleia TaxID=634127 RepID=UPI002AB717BE|nr:ATP-dependent Clp protease proteolytic subunit [Paraburkholderia heleia]
MACFSVEQGWLTAKLVLLKNNGVLMSTSVERATINWGRCIHIDDVIDDQYVNSLIPKILELRRESSAPITVAINSPGGSLAALDVLLGLLTGPDQDGQVCEIVTVSVRNAYSAAANFLAFGNYAVALPHSEILFHDVRYSGMEDVTPASARIAAARLQNANEEFSLKLATRVFRRLVWNYVDLRGNFNQYQNTYPEVHETYTRAIATCQKPEGANGRADIAGFATALFAEVSPSSETLINATLAHLARWGLMTSVANELPKYKEKGSRKPGLLDGTKNLFDSVMKEKKSKNASEIWNRMELDIHLFSLMLVENITKAEPAKNFSFTKTLEDVLDDFKLIESINDSSHKKVITRNMLRHDHMFFTKEELELVRGDDEGERKRLIEIARPNAQLFWYFCVLLCRELFNGEHILSPYDAQVLGIVDEVAGGGRVSSRRDYRKQKAAKALQSQAEVGGSTGTGSA